MSGKNGDFVEKLKYNLDIVDIISDYLPLKRVGSNYMALCPFHQEKTPSFTVNPDKQFYYCFGCGTGGDLFSFVMEMENISFREALKILADRAGLALPTLDSTFQEKDRAERELIFTINKLSAKFYHYILMKSEVGEEAVKYMENRGFDRNDLKLYYLGYAPDRWQTLTKFLLKRGFAKVDLIKAGLASQGKNGKIYDRFRNRVIFPIFNIRGEVIAFGGRILTKAENTPKYLNSPETSVYKKGKNLYGLNWALEEMRKTGNVVIMEGYTDVIQAQKHGINNAIASLGTAFTIEQAQLMKRYVSNVYISYDADAAGARATLRGLDIISKEDLNVRVIELPPDTDPDEFIKSEKKSGFDRLMDEAVNLIEFKINQAAGNYDLSKIDDKISFTKRLVKLLSEISNTIERDLHIQNAAGKYNIEVETIKKGINIYRRKKEIHKKDKNNNSSYTKRDNNKDDTESINDLEGVFIKTYLNNPEKRNNMNKLLNPIFFTNNYRELVRKILEHPEKGIDKLVESIEEDSVRKLLLALVVSEGRKEVSLERVLELFIHKAKKDIYEKIQRNQDLELKEINKLLVSFVTITV